MNNNRNNRNNRNPANLSAPSAPAPEPTPAPAPVDPAPSAPANLSPEPTPANPSPTGANPAPVGSGNPAPANPAPVDPRDTPGALLGVFTFPRFVEPSRTQPRTRWTRNRVQSAIQVRTDAGRIILTREPGERDTAPEIPTEHRPVIVGGKVSARIDPARFGFTPDSVGAVRALLEAFAGAALLEIVSGEALDSVGAQKSADDSKREIAGALEALDSMLLLSAREIAGPVAPVYLSALAPMIDRARALGVDFAHRRIQKSAATLQASARALAPESPVRATVEALNLSPTPANPAPAPAPAPAPEPTPAPVA